MNLSYNDSKPERRYRQVSGAGRDHIAVVGDRRAIRRNRRAWMQVCLADFVVEADFAVHAARQQVEREVGLRIAGAEMIEPPREVVVIRGVAVVRRKERQAPGGSELRHGCRNDPFAIDRHSGGIGLDEVGAVRLCLDRGRVLPGSKVEPPARVRDVEHGIGIGRRGRSARAERSLARGHVGERQLHLGFRVPGRDELGLDVFRRADRHVLVSHVAGNHVVLKEEEPDLPAPPRRNIEDQICRRCRPGDLGDFVAIAPADRIASVACAVPMGHVEPAGCEAGGNGEANFCEAVVLVARSRCHAHIPLGAEVAGHRPGLVLNDIDIGAAGGRRKPNAFAVGEERAVYPVVEASDAVRGSRNEIQRQRLVHPVLRPCLETSKTALGLVLGGAVAKPEERQEISAGEVFPRAVRHRRPVHRRLSVRRHDMAVYPGLGQRRIGGAVTAVVEAPATARNVEQRVRRSRVGQCIAA